MSAPQLELGDYKRPPRATTRRLAFLIFHSAHPEVLTRLVRLTRDLLQQQRDEGRKRPKVGMRAVWEIARYGINCEPVSPGTKRPVLNNDLAPEYARWIDENYGDLKGVFKLRERD